LILLPFPSILCSVFYPKGRNVFPMDRNVFPMDRSVFPKDRKAFPILGMVPFVEHRMVVFHILVLHRMVVGVVAFGTYAYGSDGVFQMVVVAFPRMVVVRMV